MEVNVTEKKENKLLSRLEVKGSLTFQGPTPACKDVQADVGKALKKDAELVVVRHVYTNFGSSGAKFEALVYDSKEALKNVEAPIKVKKVAAEAAA
ncbi:hypothetical protein HZA97_06490 [Candidatus Woesearchaeota archaeon]|nr:hypothetical protein [Candidatus Woesearchaeota archaeon]